MAPMPAYEIRGALASDEDQLLEVAAHLDTVNLPDDRESIRGILEIAHRSFSGAIKDPRRREYVFVLVDRAKERVIGTSMIIAQLGRRDAPYIYFDVIDEERYSATLDRHFNHTTLSIGYSYNGPTEIGGLILLPEYRRVPEKLGLFLSYVRFLYIKMHRDFFRDEILAELLPPLEPDGTSHLWDAVGRHFTGLTYGEADRLSKKNKEFIRGLFPEGTIYASLLPKAAQDVIGKVGAQTRGVEKMLRRIGFRYAERVDPFDGGPHFTAPTDEITLVQRATRAKVDGLLAPGKHLRQKSIVGMDLPDAPWFRATLGWVDLDGDEPVATATGEVRVAAAAGGESGCRLAPDVAEHLGVTVGDTVWVLPVD
jgi:arginine N-succinyltransferase